MQTDPTLDAISYHRLVFELIQMGRNRCSLGYGKYPLGLYDACFRLVAFAPTEHTVRALAEFKRRLEQP